MAPDPLCPLCSLSPETTEHLFLLCNWTKEIWSDSRMNIDTSPTHITRIEKWLADNLSVKRNLPLDDASPTPQSLLAETLWAIWTSRNEWVFRRRDPKPCTIIEEASNSARLYMRWNPRGRLKQRDLNPVPSRGSLPNQSWLKLSIDASWSGDSGEGAAAGILRDASGVLVSGFARKIRASSASVAETLALRDGLEFLWKVRCGKAEENPGVCISLDTEVLIQSDCLSATRWVLGQEESPWTERPIILDCASLLKRMGSVSLRFCPRSENLAADWVAKAKRTDSLCPNWLKRPPPPLYALLCLDFGHSHVSTSFHE